MNNNAILLVLVAIASSIPLCVADASDAVPGDACATAGTFRQSGGPEVVGGAGHFMRCDGSNWVSVLSYDANVRSDLQIGNDTGACAAAKTGRLRYDESGNSLDICDGSVWNAISPAAGGGSSGWAGFTTSTMAPASDQPGYLGMNAECESDFPGSRLATMKEVLRYTEDLPTVGSTTRFWANCEPQAVASGSSAGVACPYTLLSTAHIETYANYQCSQFNGAGTSAGVTRGELLASGWVGLQRGNYCSSSHVIACVYR